MIISFYSYKGGVGRTQLCANIAAYLCYQKNKRVLLWDWDFEAPGLHYFFDKTNDDINSSGTLELLENYLAIMRKKDGAASGELPYVKKEDMVPLTPDLSWENTGCIDLLPAGNYTKDFSYRAGSFDWFEFYSLMDGVTYIELLKKRLADLPYDYILIDSRTGISDYSGICNIQLPEINVMVIAATMQNFEGCRSIIKKIQNSEYFEGTERKPKILPVLSRVDLSGSKYNLWAQRFREYFSFLITTLDPKLDEIFVDQIFSDVYYRDTFLPYTTAISAGENIFTKNTEASTTNYNRPYINIAELIENIFNPGVVDFYKKVPEDQWVEYARKAESEENGKKAAIAYNQIGINQVDIKDQLSYFKKAIDSDPLYEEARVNYHRANRYLNVSQDSLPINKIVSPPQDDMIMKQKTSYVKPIIIGCSMVILLSSVIFYNYRPKPKVPVILTDSTASVGTDTIAIKPPLLNGSKYFDSVRNLGKPIGIDISRRNQIYDQSKIKQYGLSFVFIKATEGNTYKDSGYKNNWAIAKKSNFLSGAYHYFEIGTDPVEQANNFMNSVKLTNGDLPPILNLYAFENHHKIPDTTTINNIRIFLDEVTIHYGTKPIVFISNESADLLFRGDYSRYLLWINQPNAGIYSPKKPKSWKNWSFWQFSTTENLDGILTQADQSNERFIDVNQFNGSFQKLKELGIKTSPGTDALRIAETILLKKDNLYKIRTDRKVEVNNQLFSLKEFNSRSFNWSVELIKYSYRFMKNKPLNGRMPSDLLKSMGNVRFNVDSNAVNIEIGDVAFFDFQENKGIQACGMIYNYDNEFVYLIEGNDRNGKLKIRTTRRYRDDISALARVSDNPGAAKK